MGEMTWILFFRELIQQVIEIVSIPYLEQKKE